MKTKKIPIDKFRKGIIGLINEYSKLIGMDSDIVYRVFRRGDVQQKKRDLIAMRATIYMRNHFKKGMSYARQQKLLKRFAESENLTNVSFPQIIKSNETPKTS